MQARHNQSSISCQSSKRKFCRGGVAISAGIRAAGGNKNKVKVVDLSQAGSDGMPYPYFGGQVIFLTMPGFQQLASRVMWQTEWMYGCQFVHPLHAAIYDHMIMTYPALEVVPKAATGASLFAAATAWRGALDPRGEPRPAAPDGA